MKTHHASPVYPRFRSLHDAGKYISAQLYPEARKMEPEEFGAVPRYIENPEWQKAKFEAVVDFDPEKSYILVSDDEPPFVSTELPEDHPQYGKIELSDEKPRLTSADWYREYPEPSILMADGWPNPLSFSWFHELITLEEFQTRRNHSVVIQ